MRIITGKAKGCRLETLAGLDTRPTVERVKEGVFSAVCFELEGRRVLDAFAGSGQMGLEALSRGAAKCVFVDHSREAVEVIRRNSVATKLSEMAAIHNADVLSYLRQCRETFDMVFLDPPYASGLHLPCLQLLSAMVAPGGAVLCESDRTAELPDTVGELLLERTYRYGRVTVRLYRKALK